MKKLMALLVLIAWIMLPSGDIINLNLCQSVTVKNTRVSFYNGFFEESVELKSAEEAKKIIKILKSNSVYRYDKKTKTFIPEVK